MNPSVQKTSIVVNNWTKGARAGKFRIPKGTASYDIIEGVSTKKGEFVVYQFKDSLGRAIKRCSSYIKNGLESLDIRNLFWQEKGLTIRETKYKDKKQVGFSAIDISQVEEKEKIWKVTKEEIRSADDVHYMMFHKANQKPFGFKYKWLPDCPAEAYSFVNTSKNFACIKNTNLIPLLITRFSLQRRNTIIDKIIQQQAKLLGLQGLISPIKRVPLKCLNGGGKSVSQEGKVPTVVAGVAPFTGRMAISSYLSNSKSITKLYSTICHELFHIKDAMKMVQLEDFNPSLLPEEEYAIPVIEKFTQKVRKKYGIIRKTDPEYNEYKNLYERTLGYDKITDYDDWKERDIEDRAIKWQNEQNEKLIQLLKDINTRFLK